MAPTTCRNCEHNFEGNYCNNCGQSAHTHDINWHYVWHDIQHGVFHVDKGIFYTLGQLFTRPGSTIREFINGKRVKHFKPIAMVFLLATVYGFFYHYSGVNILQTHGTDTDTNLAVNGANQWMGKYYAFVMLASIPFFSLASYLAFRKSGYNIIEHVVINSFIAGQKMILQLLFLPFLYYYNGTPAFDRIVMLFVFVEIGLTMFIYNQFFIEYGKIKRFFLSLLSIIYFYAFIFSVLLITIVVALSMANS